MRKRATFYSACFVDAALTGADLRESDLRGASFDGAILLAAKLDGVQVSKGTTFVGAVDVPLAAQRALDALRDDDDDSDYHYDTFPSKPVMSFPRFGGQVMGW